MRRDSIVDTVFHKDDGLQIMCFVMEEINKYMQIIKFKKQREKELKFRKNMKCNIFTL